MDLAHEYMLSTCFFFCADSIRSCPKQVDVGHQQLVRERDVVSCRDVNDLKGSEDYTP